MTGTETDADQLPTTGELTAQLRELEKQFSAPTWEEVMPEWKWVHTWLADPSLPPARPRLDCWVAVLDQQIVGTGLDPLALRLEKARELSVHPERLVVTYVPGTDSW
jgi:hypothetical protein